MLDSSQAHSPCWPLEQSLGDSMSLRRAGEVRQRTRGVKLLCAVPTDDADEIDREV